MKFIKVHFLLEKTPLIILEDDVIRVQEIAGGSLIFLKERSGKDHVEVSESASEIFEMLTSENMKEAEAYERYDKNMSIWEQSFEAERLNNSMSEKVSELEKKLEDLKAFAYASEGVVMINQERKEQLIRHGICVTEDLRTNSKGQLLEASVYSILDNENYYPSDWDLKFRDKMVKKPKIERLAIAGALISAEIDRILLQDQIDKR